MKDAQDVIPWKVTSLALRPYDGYWSFNPSIHFDGEIWRCVLRCCDYAMPDGRTVRSKNARPTGQQTKNAMVILDPRTWAPAQVFKMHEKDDHPRQTCAHVGYEDMRLFRTDKGGLQGIAASLHLRRDRESRATEGTLPHQPPEQVIVSFDANYDIVKAQPIRGTWSGTPQKNWVPFDHCAEPRFLYSIDKGTIFGDRGTLHGDDARVRSSVTPRVASSGGSGAAVPPTGSIQNSKDEGALAPVEVAERPVPRKAAILGGDVKIMRGGRQALDAMATRPSTARSGSGSAPRFVTRRIDDSTRLMGAGRVRLPKYEGLRGGTQLVCIGPDAWLGIGHEMKFLGGKKYYWHTWYVVDASGKLTSVSESMKLAPNGIEFAAGIAIDGDRVVVSFGVDDMECRIGETQLSAVMEKLRPISQG